MNIQLLDIRDDYMISPGKTVPVRHQENLTDTVPPGWNHVLLIFSSVSR